MQLEQMTKSNMKLNRVYSVTVVPVMSDLIHGEGLGTS